MAVFEIAWLGFVVIALFFGALIALTAGVWKWMRRFTSPDTLPGATYFSRDNEMRDQVRLITEIKRQSWIWDDLRDQTTVMHEGHKPREAGHRVLVSLGFTLSQKPSLKPWWEDTTDDFWHACGFTGGKPSYHRVWRRPRELAGIGWDQAPPTIDSIARAAAAGLDRELGDEEQPVEPDAYDDDEGPETPLDPQLANPFIDAIHAAVAKTAGPARAARSSTPTTTARASSAPCDRRAWRRARPARTARPRPSTTRAPPALSSTRPTCRRSPSATAGCV